MEHTDYEARFGGIGRLYGLKALDKIRTARVLIIGVGGVGSWVAESLARTGIGAMTLVDLDDICVTNINRQILALSNTVGQFKVDVMKERLLQIQPHCEIHTKQCFFNPKNLESIFDQTYDFVVDACDDFTNKCLLIDHCRTHKIPLVVMGGAGGKTDPLQVRVTDMSTSQNDRLLMRLRKKLRQDFAFPKDEEGPFGVWSVWSHERAVYPTADGCTTFKPAGLAKNMDCSEGFLTNVANDARIPERDKKVVLALIALVISPVDLIPDWIPIFGQIDDVIIISIIMDYFFTVLDTNLLLSHYPWGMKSFVRLKKFAHTFQFLVPGFLKKKLWTYVGDPY